jgi:hypothetical protein
MEKKEIKLNSGSIVDEDKVKPRRTVVRLKDNSADN